MTRGEIETAIQQLPLEEYRRFSNWFFDFDYQHWDKQLEQDIADGKLDALAAEDIEDFKYGHTRTL